MLGYIVAGKITINDSDILASYKVYNETTNKESNILYTETGYYSVNLDDIFKYNIDDIIRIVFTYSLNGIEYSYTVFNIITSVRLVNVNVSLENKKYNTYLQANVSFNTVKCEVTSIASYKNIFYLYYLYNNEYVYFDKFISTDNRIIISNLPNGKYKITLYNVNLEITRLYSKTDKIFYIGTDSDIAYEDSVKPIIEWE